MSAHSALQHPLQQALDIPGTLEEGNLVGDHPLWAAVVSSVASYCHGRAKVIRQYTPTSMLGRYIEEILGESQKLWIAFLATGVGEPLQAPGELLAGAVDVPGTWRRRFAKPGESPGS